VKYHILHFKSKYYSYIDVEKYGKYATGCGKTYLFGTKDVRKYRQKRKKAEEKS
jgi:hypothetical protein